VIVMPGLRAGHPRLKRRCATTPLRRIGEPHEIAGGGLSRFRRLHLHDPIVINGGVTTASA
jgi:hypothetical protein